MKENPETREQISIREWYEITPRGRYEQAARAIVLSGDTTEFDAKVQAYFHRHWKGCDKPFPPRPRPQW